MIRHELFTAAIDVCDPELTGHSSRVGSHARAIATRLGWDDARLAELELGAVLHDVGKISVPPRILEKPGVLDESEREAIRAHPVEGVWLIAGVASLARAVPYVLFHHERWDGTGYPTRRAGAETPIEGRVLAVADAFDAMTSDRPYRQALTLDAAVTEVLRCAGSQFDPEITTVFLDAVESGDVALAAA
jgi:HD-GYP domain-containing protein (c-di-GMP phosphodiesterase class II)